MRKIKLYEEFQKRSKLANQFELKYGNKLDSIFIFEDPTSIELNQIIINKNNRNEGIGSEILQDVVNYSDRENKIVTLTPADDYGSSLSRLKKFYKRFGFVFNKGNNKDFRFRDSMIRYPL